MANEAGVDVAGALALARQLEELSGRLNDSWRQHDAAMRQAARCLDWDGTPSNDIRTHIYNPRYADVAKGTRELAAHLSELAANVRDAVGQHQDNDRAGADSMRV